MNITESRTKSFVIVGIVYVLATVIGVLSYIWAAPKMDDLWALLVADVVATVVTWAGGLLYKNVSVYDPYWSVAPPVLLTIYAATMPSIRLSGILMLLVVWVWAIRLTVNWAITFKGLRHEDWRYTKHRTSCHPVIFQTINFFGLNMMPTLVVYLAMIPAISLLQTAADCTIWTCIGAVMSLAAAAIQYSADTTAHRFRREHPGEICKVGLWKHGRHPNYFGEILMWWGIWVMALPTDRFFGLPTMVDSTIAGAISITLLFLCISVPLMESRQMKNKPGYAQYRKETRVLI